MPFPRVIPHQDGAGVIESVGSGVPAERVGERVWVYEATWNRAGGTAAEFTVVPPSARCGCPTASISTPGACLGIPAMTAHRAVFADGPVTGQVVLVTGGAGAVGTAAVQFAKWGGASEVLATVSSDAKAAAARDAGADHIINYKTDDVVAIVNNLPRAPAWTASSRSTSAATCPSACRSSSSHGTIASYATRGDPEPKVPFRALMVKNITVHGVLVYTMPESAKAAAMADVTRALEEGALRPLIGARLPLDRVADAHTAVERGTIIGNVVLQYA